MSSNIWKPIFCFLFANVAQNVCRDSASRDCPVSPPIGEFWNQTVVKYYEGIIEENTEAALHYQLPTDNTYFLAGNNNAQTNESKGKEARFYNWVSLIMLCCRCR